MKKFVLDATDIRILSAVQSNCQLSKYKLAEAVNLSPTPCWTRLQKLKAAGYIRGCHADISLELVGDFTKIIVTLSLASHRKADFDRFEHHIHKQDEIVECIATGGGTDYVLKVITPRLSSFQNLMDDILNAEIGIDRFTTHIVTREVKSSRPNLSKLVSSKERRDS